MSDSTPSISAFGFTVKAAPMLGATVTRILWRGPDGRERDLLHAAPVSPETGTTRSRFGVWPMLPFANRAFGAVMDDGETRLSLPVNDGAGGTIHGFGWQAAWGCEAGADALALDHRRTDGPDPYRYHARMTVRLLPGHVRLELAVVNEADRALPFGLGLHPWFAATPATVIRAAARGELALGEGYRPTGFRRFADGGPYAEGAHRPAGAEIALSLVDWMGPAYIEDATLGLRVRVDASPNLRHPVLWSPADAPFVCFEPQSHAIGAPSERAARDVTPLARLQPGGSLSGWMTLTPSLIGPAR